MQFCLEGDSKRDSFVVWFYTFGFSDQLVDDGSEFLLPLHDIYIRMH